DANAYGLLRQLAYGPGQEVLAEEKHKEDHEAKGIKHPEQLATENHRQGGTGDGPDAEQGGAKLASPGSVVEQISGYSCHSLPGRGGTVLQGLHRRAEGRAATRRGYPPGRRNPASPNPGEPRRITRLGHCHRGCGRLQGATLPERRGDRPELVNG